MNTVKTDKGADIRCARDAREALGNALEGLGHEELHAMYLDRENRILETRLVASGDAESVPISPAAVLARALALGAAAVIIAHNHPSGNPEPGTSDISETERMKKACDLLGVILRDHIIVAGEKWFSFAEGRSFGSNSDGGRRTKP